MTVLLAQQRSFARNARAALLGPRLCARALPLSSVEEGVGGRATAPTNSRALVGWLKRSVRGRARIACVCWSTNLIVHAIAVQIICLFFVRNYPLFCDATRLSVVLKE